MHLQPAVKTVCLFFSLILVFVLYYQKSKRFLPVPAFAGFLNLGSDV
jgi:hypothetical protein